MHTEYLLTGIQEVILSVYGFKCKPVKEEWAKGIMTSTQSLFVKLLKP